MFIGYSPWERWCVFSIGSIPSYHAFFMLCLWFICFGGCVWPGISLHFLKRVLFSCTILLFSSCFLLHKSIFFLFLLLCVQPWTGFVGQGLVAGGPSPVSMPAMGGWWTHSHSSYYQHNLKLMPACFFISQSSVTFQDLVHAKAFAHVTASCDWEPLHCPVALPLPHHLWGMAAGRKRTGVKRLAEKAEEEGRRRKQPLYAHRKREENTVLLFGTTCPYSLSLVLYSWKRTSPLMFWLCTGFSFLPKTYMPFQAGCTFCPENAKDMKLLKRWWKQFILSLPTQEGRGKEQVKRKSKKGRHGQKEKLLEGKRQRHAMPGCMACGGETVWCAGGSLDSVSSLVEGMVLLKKKKNEAGRRRICL